MICGINWGILVAWALAPAPLVSQENDASKGLMTAKRLCAECHAVQLGETRSPVSSAPTFSAIAGVSGMTQATLRAALHTSHRTLSNGTVPPDELDAIIAYILNLRQPG